MRRRKFNQLFTAGMALTAASCSPKLVPTSTTTIKPQIKPKRLRQNDLVSLVSPGSYISDEGLETAVNNLEKLGFRVKLGKHIRAEYGYVAGTDEQRLHDLHAGFKDKEVKAVWCVRGGYGCSRLLPNLDYALIRKNPKALIGYSDITALLNAIYLKTGLVGFHGPVGASELTDYNRMHLEAVLMEGASNWTIQRPDSFATQKDAAYQIQHIKTGKAEGILIGGNLSLLSAMAGTGFLPNFNQHLVFIEEVGEKPYRVDRMLTQLRQSNGLASAAGIALGIFSGCAPEADDSSLSLPQTLEDRLGKINCPVTYGLPFGHISNICTLPVGVKARLDVGAGTLTLLEAGVV